MLANNEIKNDIIERLLKLDEEVSLVFDNDTYYEMVLVGGGALVLIDKLKGNAGY